VFFKLCCITLGAEAMFGIAVEQLERGQGETHKQTILDREKKKEKGDSRP